MAINPMLLMQALRMAPQLMGALKNALGGYSPNPSGVDTSIEEAIDRNYDPKLLEDKFTYKTYLQDYPDDLALRQLNDEYSKYMNNSDFANTAQGFPSDWADSSDLINLADRMLGNPNIVDTPALTSAAVMFNNGLLTDDAPLPGVEPPHPTGSPTFASHLGELLHDTDGSQDEDARKAYLEWFRTHGYK